MFTFRPRDILPEVVVVEPARHGDVRGWFAEVYKLSEFAAHGIVGQFCQDNHSLSAETGTLRGLHYQVAPFAQAKLIRVVAGVIYDVVVDIRRASPTFGRWTSGTLSAAELTMLWVPDGFAHGFQTLAPNTEVMYKTTAEYSRPHERGLRWDDPDLGIPWPVPVSVLAERDRVWPGLSALV